nr:succinylglutamate desuccinylase/aspartoacylase family protein [uncultured Methanobrevibacter sp.]
MVKAAKKGAPVIKFKGGSGNVVFITAGVHGNELSSQVAAMKLIKYLEGHPIRGTVYIMPFMNPKGTAKNVRDYNGVHLNKLANKKGTISYKTVNLITKFKCKAYGDFHCTKPGGKPGKDVAMGTYHPTAQSAEMAKYISKNSKVKYLIYNLAGDEYPGALEDTVSLKGIPAVTCEVITPHGKIAKGTPAKSLSMMKSFLKFNSLI